ncbi:MAG: tetratricopeptide repeat protein [Methylocella sp.]
MEIDPRNAMAYHNRGVAYTRKGDHHRAIADSSKAIEIDPRYRHGAPPPPVSVSQ